MKNVEVVKENSNLKNKKGITLIALVITIIVLLILAGVSIATITGENGILKRATTAKQKNDEAVIDENGKIGSYEDVIDNYNSRGDTITISKTELQELIKQEVKNQMGSEITGSGSKEILWETEATGTREVTLEKNISDYDLIIVYFRYQGMPGEFVFDNFETTTLGVNYSTTKYLNTSVKLDKENNKVSMTTATDMSSWAITSVTYLSKIVGIKL